MSFRHHARRNLLLTAALAFAVIASLLNTLPARAATQTLGGVATEGTLTITVLDTGQMNVTRYVGGAWQNQIYIFSTNGASKGSALQINGTLYKLGYYSYYSGIQATTVSNTKVGNTITTVQTAGGTQIVQTTTYIPGNAYYSLQWEITNTSGASLSDLRLFHGEDTFLQGGDNGSGWWAPSITSIGVRKIIGSVEQRMSLQGITTPYAYESDYYSFVRSSVSNGALSNVVDPNEATDNGYALEWRQASLADGAIWTINALESFTSGASGALMVIAPIATTCTVGVACDLIYTVVNNSGTDVSTPLTLTSNQSWGETIVSPASPTTVIAGGSTSVTVRVTPSVGTGNGTLGQLTLTVNDGTTNSSDIATISVLGSPSAPSITSPSASSRTNTTPTISGTAEANSSVVVTDGDTIICSVTADALGDWTCPALTFTGGSHTISVTAANVRGTGTASTRTFTVDTAVPAVLTVTNPVAGSRTTPTASFNGTTDPNITVTVSEGGVILCTTTSDGSGNWACTTSALTGGNRTLSVTATNGFGSTSPVTRAIIVDAAVPAAPTISSPVANSRTTPTASISGTTDPNITVTVSEGGVILCTTTADANGDWTCTPSTALSGGSHTVDVIATNSFGSTTPTTHSFTVDTTIPAALTVSSPVANSRTTPSQIAQN